MADDETQGRHATYAEVEQGLLDAIMANLDDGYCEDAEVCARALFAVKQAQLAAWQLAKAEGGPADGAAGPEIGGSLSGIPVARGVSISGPGAVADSRRS